MVAVSAPSRAVPVGLVLLALLCVSCDRLERRDRSTPAAPAAPPQEVAARVDTLVVVRPTLVPYFAATQAEIDAEPEIGEAMADFQHYLVAARDSLERRGVLVRELRGDSLVVRQDSTTRLLLPAEQQSAVGYAIYAPGREPRIIQGVMTDAALLAAVDEYLAP